jgi:hypothetical protein
MISGSARLGAARALADPELEQDALERTKAGERRLEQIEPNKGGQEEPELVNPVAKSKAGEHEAARYEIDDALDFHIDF